MIRYGVVQEEKVVGTEKQQPDLKEDASKKEVTKETSDKDANLQETE